MSGEQLWTTVQSAINRADSAAYDAQSDVNRAISDLHRLMTRLTDASNRLRAARVELQRLDALAADHGADHEIAYESAS